MMEKKDFIIKSEGLADFYIHSADENSIPSKSMNVFYNKKMEINRDISSLAIMAYKENYNQESLTIIDSMAASGIGSIRLLKECENVKKIYINDINPVAIDLINRNIELNNIDEDKVKVSKKDANNLFTEIVQQSHIESENMDRRPNVISIDPFGTPNLYIDNAFKVIQKIEGLMCITATDTAVLFGVRPNACIRKYMSKSLHNGYCKEIGARILLHYISRMANINKMGIIPLLTFYSNHFIRIFALTFKNQKNVSKYFNSYGYIFHCKACNYRTAIGSNILDIPKACPSCGSSDKVDFAGPLWVNEIHNEEYIKKVISLNESSEFKTKKRIDKMLKFAMEEINMPPSYYRIHRITQNLKLEHVPKSDDLINTIIDSGYKASRTHFDFTAIKTDMPLETLKKKIVELKKKS